MSWLDDLMGTGDPLGSSNVDPRLLSQIMQNPVGTESIGPEARNLQPGTQPIQSVMGIPMRADIANSVRQGLPTALGFSESPGILAGVKSRTADMEALRWAQDSEAQGTSADTIWQHTGWARGADGAWRYEIPDQYAGLGSGVVPNPMSKAGLMTVEKGSEGYNTLGNVLNHPELYDAYPHLKDIQVGHTLLGDISAGVKGSFNPDINPDQGGFIRLTGAMPEDMLSTALHETQHAVQHMEGFEPGANPNNYLPPGHATFRKDLADKKAEITQALSDTGSGLNFDDVYLAHLYPGSNKNLLAIDNSDGISDMMQDYIAHARLVENAETAAYNKYHTNAGEVEARNVQARAKLAPYDLRNFPPNATADVPISDQTFHSSMLDDPAARDALLTLRRNGQTQ